MNEPRLRREDMSPEELAKATKDFEKSTQRPNINDCEELKEKPADPRSIGERRLHIDIINCSDTVAAYTCHMIDDLERMRSKTRNPEAGRLISETQTQLQQAYLWYKEVLASL